MRDPAWAKSKPGDKRKYVPPRNFIVKMWRHVVPNCHVPCGGTWREVGTSGMIVLRVYFKCDRCGAQASEIIDN